MSSTILIVDGDRRFVGRLRTLFSGRGYSVLSASTAAEGIATITEFKMQLAVVILGIGAPDGHELEIIDRIGRWTDRTKPRVVAACDGPMTERTVHADRTLLKVSTDEEWLSAIASLLGQPPGSGRGGQD